MTGTELIVRERAVVSLTFEQVEKISQDVMVSRIYENIKTAHQARLQILMGQEIGFGPMASLTAIQVIKGKPCVSAGAMAALIKASGRYDYKTVQRDLRGARIMFYEKGEPVGEAEFTAQDAQQAGLLPPKPDSGWHRYPKAMLWARAISDGFKRFCGDLTMGNQVYTAEEVGGEPSEADRKAIMAKIQSKLKKKAP